MAVPNNTRDDFTDATKRRLALRVAYRCSNPGCRAETAGPSESAVSGVSLTGVAAHITAASEDGPRFNASISTPQRKHADNGIWLCGYHGSIVDSDHSRYSVELLQSWKSRAEALASMRREPSAASTMWDFFPYQQGVALSDDEPSARGEIHESLSQFLDDVGVKDVLTPDDGDVASNLLYEMVLNAHRHEGARYFDLWSEAGFVTARYSSDSGFGLAELLDQAGGRGGYDAAEMLESETEGRVQLNFRRSGTASEWLVSRIKLGYSADPCAINLRDSSGDELEVFVGACVGCETVHVHGHLFDHTSDNWVTARYVKQLVDTGNQVVVHSKPGPLARHLERTIREVLSEDQDVRISVHA
jgi:hypothetical protein